MPKTNNVILLVFLQSCSINTNNLAHTDNSYFNDSSDCFRSSERKVALNVPTAGTMSIIEVPIGNEATLYGLCMEHAGHHRATQTDPEAFFRVSRACSQLVRPSSSTDVDFAKCVRRGNISVESIRSD
jgi:hypothetical protein